MSFVQRLRFALAALRFMAGGPGGVAAPPRLVPATTKAAAFFDTPEAEQQGGVRPARVHIRTRWDPAQRDEALREAEDGNLEGVALFCDAMRADGVISGLMGVRTSGMIRLPAKFSGDPFLVDRLRGRDPVYERGVLLEHGLPSEFWRMCPDAEQTSMLFDGILAGVGLGELVPQREGPPVLRQLDLHWLRYEHETDTFFYRTRLDEYVVTPGDGRWVLFTPYGRNRPWLKGLWWACALPFIAKQNAAFDRLRWQSHLADPLKVIKAGQGADEKHRKGLLEFVTRLWRRAPALVTPPGYEAALVESHGRGYEVYTEAEERADKDLQVALSGNTVAVDGGPGFANANIFRDIAADKTAAVAEAWATCLHDQVVEPWSERYHGARDRAPWVRWDIRSPEQRAAEADALAKLADAVVKADAMLLPRGARVDLEALLDEQGLSLPTEDALGEAPPAAMPIAPLAGDDAPPTDEAATELAAKMTAHGIARCEHGALNRCRLCGIERVRDFEPGARGRPPAWRIAWRPIPKESAARLRRVA